jgi:hypothetical protein
MSNIIQGNFGAKPNDPIDANTRIDETDGKTVREGNGYMSPDQEKAIKLIMSGVTFVFIGIKPAPTGADFYTALHGDATDLRNAQDHLPDVIDRLYTKKGIS